MFEFSVCITPWLRQVENFESRRRILSARVGKFFDQAVSISLEIEGIFDVLE